MDTSSPLGKAAVAAQNIRIQPFLDDVIRKYVEGDPDSFKSQNSSDSDVEKRRYIQYVFYGRPHPTR